jgi:hypothetical protein
MFAYLDSSEFPTSKGKQIKMCSTFFVFATGPKSKVVAITLAGSRGHESLENDICDSL